MFTETEDERRRRLQKLFMGEQGTVAAGTGDMVDSGLGGPLGLLRSRPSMAMKIGDIRAQAPSAPAAPALLEKLMGSRKTKAEMDDLRANGVPEEKGFWRRLGSGALKGLRSYAEAGPEARSLGIGGLIGAIAGGGISSAASPKLHAEWTRDRKLGQLMGKYGGEIAVDAAEEKRQQDMLKTAQEGVDLRAKGVDLQQKAAKPYIDAALLKDHMTDEEIQHLTNVYGLDLPKVVDKGDYKETEVNGQPYIRRASSSKWEKQTTLPRDPLKVPLMAKPPGGSTVPLPVLPGTVYSGQVQTGIRNTALDSQAQRDARTAQERQDRETLAATSKLSGAQGKITSLFKIRDNKIAAGQDTTSVDLQIAAARGTAGETTPYLSPDRAKSFVSPSSIKKLPTEDQARQYYKSQGKSPKEIEDSIRKARNKKLLK